MPLWVVRHARPLIAPGVCYGALDVPVCPQATRDDAEALAQYMPQRAQLWISPLQKYELLTHELYALRPDLTKKPMPKPPQRPVCPRSGLSTPG